MPTCQRLSAPSLLLMLSTVFMAACSPKEDPWQGQREANRLPISAQGLVLRPEADRFLNVFILGLEPFKTGFYKVPQLTKKPAGISDAAFRDLQKQLYAFNFEHTHGALMRLLPPNANLYVAAPEGPDAGPAGIEKEAFVEYLRQRCYWDDEDLARRLRFFRSKTPLVWMQDAGEILGHDRRGRAVIRVDAQGRPEYLSNIRSLVDSYPDRFTLLETEEGVPAEGGDQELVWLPDGTLGLMAGRNRVVQHFRNRRDGVFDPREMTRELAEEARKSFSATFHQLPVFFVPWTVLLNPGLGSEELFHSDMVLVLMRNQRGHHAFVPTYRGQVGDSNYLKPLDPALVRACQSEYDEVARQMEGMGYETRRLPFSDHPVRSPANVLKYFDRYAMRHTVMLGHYPYHLPLDDPQTPARRLEQALAELGAAAAMLEEQPGPQTVKDLEDEVGQAWAALVHAGNSPNPDYQEQAEAFREAGYHVIPVPIYPGGSGGLHCMALR